MEDNGTVRYVEECPPGTFPQIDRLAEQIAALGWGVVIRWHGQGGTWVTAEIEVTHWGEVEYGDTEG